MHIYKIHPQLLTAAS